MLRITDEVDFNEELYKKNIEENTFNEQDELDGKGEDDVADN